MYAGCSYVLAYYHQHFQLRHGRTQPDDLVDCCLLYPREPRYFTDYIYGLRLWWYNHDASEHNIDYHGPGSIIHHPDGSRKFWIWQYSSQHWWLNRQWFYHVFRNYYSRVVVIASCFYDEYTAKPKRSPILIDIFVFIWHLRPNRVKHRQLC